ncbi:MmgE/PrpD family protein [Micromonospora sp. NBC_01412]|uniref:MmgE/PrpD family protein n=1 Tax=Micromonospora sp. NBC_01412 TaxID=2903590 RepID=UPI00324707FD
MTTTDPAAHELARGLVDLSRTGLTSELRAHAARSLLNVVATAIGACRDRAVEIVIATALDNGGERRCPVPGRMERLDPLSAALATGLAAHLDDFDDTHLDTVVHPGAAVLGAVVAVLPDHETTGPRLLDAVALGLETQLRLARAMTPWHYDDGWHITGTVGALGAAVTAGLLLELSPGQLGNAIAIASSMTLGHREGFGTMVKPFHPGKAAANGVLAAALARRDFTGSPTALEGPRGYFRALSPTTDLARLTTELGTRWEFLDNTVKPYPCGIVAHPAIEAAERLHARLAGRTPVAVRVHCHPLVAELTGNPAPDTGLAARFSTMHGVAAALADGVVGLAQYEDARVVAPDVTALRAVTTLIIDESMARDAATVEVVVSDGPVLTESVTHARGSAARPMTDTELDLKVTALVERTRPGQGPEVIAAVRGLPSATSCGDLLTTIVGEPA